MSLKIRCTGCKKKISVDEAFAGGVCRCPYCSEIVNVPGGEMGGGRIRPVEPGGRPESPMGVDERPDSPEAAAVSTSVPADPAPKPEHIPLARPVMIQGILSIVFLAAFVVMAAAVAFVLYKQLTKPPEIPPTPPPPASNPFEGARVGAAAIIGIEVTPPLLYLVDGGGSMSDSISYAQKMVRMSLRTIKEGQVNVLVLTDEGVKRANEGFMPAVGAEEKVKALFAETHGRGATNLEAGVMEALAAKPATLVVMAAKGLGDDAIAAIVAKAKESKTVVHCIVLMEGADIAEAMKKLATQTGGRCKAFSVAELNQWNTDTKELD
jgi:hypothetical protein